MANANGKPDSGDLELASLRTLLFVPADNPRRLDSAWRATVDAVVVDLEDGVAGGRKQAARGALISQLDRRSRPHGALAVRINALDTPHARDDLELLRRSPAQVDAVVVPKADAAAIRTTVWPAPVIALVETASAVLGAPAIAACEEVERLMLGPVDLAAELGVEVGSAPALIATARSTLALASAAAGLAAPIDGPWLAIDDEVGLRRDTEAARSMGFTAKACIHPAQVAPVDEELRPTLREIERARRIVSAADAALVAGKGAISVDGEMVDRPVLESARRILRLESEGS